MLDSRIVLGFDPGTAITGYGVLRVNGGDLEVLEYGVIRTPTGVPMPERLVEIFNKSTELIDRYSPVVAGCEQLFFAKNVTTAMQVSQARGVLLLVLAQNNIPLFELTPPQVKQAVTGYGSADKLQVQYMTQQILHLKEAPKPDDAADALAVAIATSGAYKG